VINVSKKSANQGLGNAYDKVKELTQLLGK